MPRLSPMELGRQLFVKMRRKRKGEFTVPVIARGLEVHFYLGDFHQLEFLRGCLTAEELCAEAAKKCGISPLCFNLFALYDESRDIWYPPNHTFKIEESTSLKLHYRMRFYFTNWHGTNSSMVRVCRHAISKRKTDTDWKTQPEGSPLLDAASLKYIFAQGQCDFLKGRAAMRSPQNEEEFYLFENECLGMAVLSISHHAMDKNISIPNLAGETSYKKYIPESMNRVIRQRNFLTRLRIARVFQHFLTEFNNRTVQSNNVTSNDIKVKYLATLETLTCGFGCEVYEPEHLCITDSEGKIPELASSCDWPQPTYYQVLVSGNSGLKWRKKTLISVGAPKDKSKSKKFKTDYRWSKPVQDVWNDWKSFSDFHEITHIIIKGSTVTVYKQDNKKMELCLGFHAEALSFATLIDGYFRLTVDAHHFLCTDVAPPSVVRNLQEGCHGPISMDYTTQKLRQEGGKEGTYVLRWSCNDYDNILLTVTCNELDLVENKQHRSFQIKVGPDGYGLSGMEMRKPSLRELMEHLRGQSLSADRVTFQLRRACPPQPREISNLLLITKRDVDPTHSTKRHLIFDRIFKEDIVQEKHLGCGTRTHIYAGRLRVRSEEEKDTWGYQASQEVAVVLKVLGSEHRDLSLAFFETVSVMRQVSHKHMALVHGICVRNLDNIIVEEFVKLGPLDLFMRGHRKLLSTPWKFQVAEQLASALSYLEDKKLVHGYVCAKNVLVERGGLDRESGPFIKLSGPGVPISVLNSQACVDRIPWIAPECVRDPQSQSISVDKWAFGTTLWEICYEGEVPLKDKKLIEKESFYGAKCALATPDCPQMADLIAKCMTYDPKRRPFFRAIVRDLTGVAEQNPTMATGLIPPLQEEDPTVFEIRFLRKIKDLGEGHFGKVELCQYDARGDGRGKLVAVKSLKPESQGQQANLRREIDTMRELYHHNIVKYKGVCSEDGGTTIKLIMEYLPAGSLKDYLPQRKYQTDLKRLLQYAVQICQGMEYLGSQRFIHRDLAARNVLVKNESTVKIGDFGLTKSIKEDKNYYTVREETDSPVFWYAPECLIDSKFYSASDVWSFGVTLYELMTYCEGSRSPTTVFMEMLCPTKGRMIVTRLVEVLKAGRRLPCPSRCPDTVYSLMRRCWESVPEDRILFTDLITELEQLLEEMGPDPLSV